ncbi:MAG TPA: hypothetical protein VGK52_08055 [Polyangia bacterium]|jgi:hypothetical protein
MYGSIPIVVLGLLAGSFAGSCVQISGGSVEVSWVVHANGRAITDCSCAVAPNADPNAPPQPIASVRIEIVGQHGAIDGSRPCAGRSQCQFACQRQTGATPFDVPETHGDEMYAISVVAVGADGADLPGIIAPAPILRTVVRGQPTEVEAFLLEAACAMGCEGMNSTAVCTRP